MLDAGNPGLRRGMRLPPPNHAKEVPDAAMPQTRRVPLTPWDRRPAGDPPPGAPPRRPRPRRPPAAHVADQRRASGLRRGPDIRPPPFVARLAPRSPGPPDGHPTRFGRTATPCTASPTAARSATPPTRSACPVPPTPRSRAALVSNATDAKSLGRSNVDFRVLLRCSVPLFSVIRGTARSEIGLALCGRRHAAKCRRPSLTPRFPVRSSCCTFAQRTQELRKVSETYLYRSQELADRCRTW